MKDFIKKNKINLIFIFIILILLISLFATCFGTEENSSFENSLGIVNTKHLNMRSGTGITFNAIDILNKNEYVKIFGKVGSWYIVQNEEDQIGTVHENYITPTSEEKAATFNSETIESISSLNLSTDEEYLLNLINQEREKNNLVKFEIDENLQNVARLKAEDLVNNNYFSHISPTYGTPFEMLKAYEINYKTASENIAGNSNIDSALQSLLNSESHKTNILSNEYNYTGIGIVDSIAYGKIIVQLFIGK